MTEAGIRPRSLTCIPRLRAQARTASDWPGGATFVTVPVAATSLGVAQPGRSGTGTEDAFLVAAFLVAACLVAACLVAGCLVAGCLVAGCLVAAFLFAALLVAG